VIAEQLASRHPRTVVLTINLVNDLFEAQHLDRDRHAVWDGWAVRKETAPDSITSFPGRDFLYRHAHLFFALRKLRQADDKIDERGVASEGTWKDIVSTGEQIQKQRGDLEAARHKRLADVSWVHNEIKDQEAAIDDRKREVLGDSEGADPVTISSRARGAILRAHHDRLASMTLRHALVRLVTPLVWRVPGRGARKLYGFARAEQASRIDLLLAAQRTASLPRRALYLRHALDKTRHAAMFWRRSTELRLDEHRAPFTPPVADTEDLFERLGERRFLAFVHRGERRGREQFELYARHFGERGGPRTEALFQAILVDERRHESYTCGLLVALAGEPAARSELRRAALWEAWRT
jgi:hypothetical protein